MSTKHELVLEDFANVSLWTFDDDSDDGTFIPLVPECFESGELDAGAVFAKNVVQLADGSCHEAIIGLRDCEEKISGEIVYRWEVYLIHFFERGQELCINIPMQIENETLEIELCNFLGRCRSNVFPLIVSVELDAIQCRFQQQIDLPPKPACEN